LATGKLDVDLIEGVRNNVLREIAGSSGILRLFHTQLQSLREYYGRQYESIIDQLDDDHNNDHELNKMEPRERENDIMVEAAQRFTEGFRTAAQNAIPLMCSEGTLEGLVTYTYMSELDGLIKDMMHATSSRKIINDEWDDAMFSEDDSGDSDTGLVTGKTQRPSKWYHKLAARSFIFGVNYLQGWLALQGIRKAASDRDKLMPKFPLF